MTVPFAETSYGIGKRLVVIASWVESIARQRANGVLDILDVGCGTGEHLTAPLAARGYRVVGVDVHAASIEAARSRRVIPGLSFELGDVADVRGTGRQFDVVICSEVLEHVDDPREFLTAVRPLVRSSGALILTTPNGYGSYEWLSSAERCFRRLGLHQLLRWIFWNGRSAARRMRRLPVPSRPLEALTSASDAGFLNVESGHVQFFSAGRLEALFEQAGFHVLSRRARTFLCGPYVDALFSILPRRSRWYGWNNAVADRLPFGCAADWMFLLRPRE